MSTVVVVVTSDNRTAGHTVGAARCWGSAAQSARSGMRQYQAEGGFKDAGISLDLNYNLTDNWGLTGQVGYKRLLGDAADSPLVEDRGSANQFTTGLLVSYEF